MSNYTNAEDTTLTPTQTGTTPSTGGAATGTPIATSNADISAGDSSAYYDPNQYYYGYDYSGTAGADGKAGDASSTAYNYDTSQYYYDPNYYSQYYGTTTTGADGSSSRGRGGGGRGGYNQPHRTISKFSHSYANYNNHNSYNNYNNYNAYDSTATAYDPTSVAAVEPHFAKSTAGAGASRDPNNPVIQMSTSGYTGPNTPPASSADDQKKKKKKPVVRAAAGETWEDPTLQEWDDNDFRLFAGDLGNEVTDEILFKAFSKYPSLQRTRVVRDKRNTKSRGYGFISFKDPNDFVKAWREMNGKYVGNRPIKLRKSNWKERNMDVKTKKERERVGPYPKVR
ncbi:hypothetical protein BDB00DRAFT_812716 [Zychaea mexicana]|uniref:uncharacterized protein n=1 Tax=Zychaea mexicana TaxID=64656 RepID=UPI0022FDC10D|nr:uncharacterized protein BDB00DRAFT_812716 [Zychaea mexicana]KAI9495631.1 hypothetical protein BDB00DRAFT_812716 [Zychaea mexicana]